MSGKRANIFGQGRPEDPYNDRDSSEPDVPVRATAAQLAQRKIKVAKGRRPAGASPTPTPSTSFASPQSSGFTFGDASAPASNGVNFGASNNTFGGGVNNSFPPAQSAAPSDSFSNSSFPAFGASNQTTGFNFTSNSASVPNPFGQLNGASPAASAAPAPAFGASSAFTSQPPNNTFGAFSQNNNTSAAPGSSLFGSTSAPSTSAPAATTFGFGFSGTAAQDNTSTPASTSSLFSFPATTTASQNNISTSNTSNPFGFGAPTPATSGQTQPAIFGGFTSSEQQQTIAPSTTQPNPFGANTSKPAFTPSPSLFNFSASSSETATSSAASSSALFSNMDSSTSQASPFPKTFTTEPSKPSPVPAPGFGNFGQQANPVQQQAQTNPFSGFKFSDPSADAPKPALFSSVSTSQQQPAFSAPETSKPALFSSVSAPQQQPAFSAPETPKPSLFSNSQVSQQEATPAASETPKPNLFSSLAKAQQSAADSSKLNFGTPKNTDSTPAATAKPSESMAFPAPKTGSFSLFSTPQPAKTAEAEKPQAGLFSAQPKPSTGMFSQTFQSGNSNTFKAAPSFTPSVPQAAEVPKEAPTKPIASTSSTNLFAKAQPSAPNTTSFTPTKEKAPTSSASPMPTLTGGTSAPSGTVAPELPRIPKAHVPKAWDAAVSALNNNYQSQDLVVNLALQLEQLNENYRAKLSNLSPLADWSALSIWHHQQSSAIKKQIDLAKKQRAQAKGITGNESSLSTKRKVQDRDPEDQHASPTKRSRPADTDTSPTPQPSMSASPTPTATSSLFAKALGPQRSAAPESTSLFTPKTSSASAPEAPKFGASNTGLKPAVPGAIGQGVASPSSLFKPTTSSAPSSAAGGFKPTSAGGFKPTSAGGSSGGFASQFAAKAKTYEELRAERKKKAKDEDYDSDDETEEQWSARWDKAEDARLAKEKAEVASASGFSMPSSVKTSGASTPATNLFSGLAKPATATSSSTNGLFNSRPASPALSTGSQSVFDAPSTSHAASPNIFGHLSSGPSSSNQDHSSDEEEPAPAVAPLTTPPKRKADHSVDEADEAQNPKRQEAAPKGSLLSRMTKSTDDGSESEKENGTSGSVFGSTNGTTTPKPFAYFNFEAAGTKTAPPKSETFGGDQTFKMGTPIKFGGAPATEKKADTNAPTFLFQPASTSTTPSKPPPSLFNFGSTTSGSSLLAPAGGFSGFNSAPSSAFSSRAATPLSEADTSAQSAAEDEEEKQEQVDLSQLTDEELKSNDIVFETPIALAKHLVDKGDGTKTWEIFAKGPLWILKDKVTGKCFVRVRIASGATPLNYNILPALKAQSKGSGGKSVQVTMPKKEGGFAQIFIFFRNSDFAEEFTTKYNESLPA